MPPFCRSRWVQPPTSRVDEMGELREFDLQLALGAAGTQREDVEDEARAVDDAALERALQVALLHAGERVVEDHEVGAGLPAQRIDFLDLALAGEERGIGPRAAARDAADDVGAGGQRERADLLHPVLAFAVAEVEGDDERAIAAGGPLKHRPAPVRYRAVRGARAIRLRRRDWARGAALPPGAPVRPWRWRACTPSG